VQFWLSSISTDFTISISYRGDRMKQRSISTADTVVSEGVYPSAVGSRHGKIYESEWLIWAVQACTGVLGLIVFSPLLLLIAFTIKLTDGGAIFYRGERVGRGKRIFKIYKFRTLVEGAEKKIGARLLRTEDQGIYYTKIGRFLKRSKLDELPQLLNVIRGEMRLTGPRPVRPIFLDQFERSIANYPDRFMVPPGITGIAQLRGGYYTSPRNKLRYDLIYIKRRSLLLDFAVVFFTFAKILNRWFNRGFFVLFLFLFVSFLPAGLQPSLYVTFFGTRVSLLYLFIIVVAAGLFFKKGPTQVCLHRGPLNFPLVLFFALSAVSALFAEDLHQALLRAGYYIVTGFMVAFLIVNSLATKGFIILTARVIALTSVVMSVFGLFQIFLFNYTVAMAAPFSGEQLAGYIRASSFLGNPVVLAVYLVLGLPLLLSEVTRASRQRERDFWLVCATLSFVGIFFTQTRIGLLALLVTGTAFLSRRRSHAIFFVTICLVWLLSLIALGGARFSPAGIRGEVTAWVAKQLYILREIPVKTWLIGGGVVTPYPLVTEPIAETAQSFEEEEAREIPNMHVTLALEHGIVGWCVIVWLILTAVRTMTQAHRSTRDHELKSILWAIVSSLVGFLVSMNAMNVFHNLPLQIFFWSLIGIGLGTVVHLNGYRRSNLIWRFGDAGD
jgi:lipopolysaccharide/colanic/teichoic acid biosynthesis glycosyltransferase